MLNVIPRGSSGTMPACEFVDVEAEVYNLAQVRHGTVGKSPNPLGISSGDRRVCTTFWIRIETFRQAEVKSMKQGFLLPGGFGDTSQADLSPIRCG